jgi:hypothetical protein
MIILPGRRQPIRSRYGFNKPSITVCGNDTIVPGASKYSVSHFVDRHAGARTLFRSLVARRNAADHIGKTQA